MSDLYSEFEVRRKKFHTALGSVFDSFARAERELVAMLGKLAGLNHDLTNALLSGARADSAISQTRRVYRALKKELPKELDSALIQLKVINNDRNLLAHHGTIENLSVGWIASNYRVALPDAQMNEVLVEPEKLEAMSADLAGITLIFAHFFENQMPTKYPNLNALIQDALKASREHAWHYKSEKPKYAHDQE